MSSLITQVRAIVTQHVADDPAGLYAIAENMMVSTRTIERELSRPHWTAAFAVGCVDALGLNLTITPAAAEPTQA